jgi:undecaprenyl-diphosphatase
MNSTVAYGAILIAAYPFLSATARRVAIVASAIVVVVIAATRVALGVHYPSDVIAGIIAGIAWLAVCYAFYTRRHRRNE